MSGTESPGQESIERVAIGAEIARRVTRRSAATPQPLFGIVPVVEAEQTLDLISTQVTGAVAVERETFKGGTPQILAARLSEQSRQIIRDCQCQFHRSAPFLIGNGKRILSCRRESRSQNYCFPRPQF